MGLLDLSGGLDKSGIPTLREIYWTCPGHRPSREIYHTILSSSLTPNRSITSNDYKRGSPPLYFFPLLPTKKTYKDPNLELSNTLSSLQSSIFVLERRFELHFD
jgi:hypothetical protein